MLVIPALDLRGGRLVRLWQGDYQRETVYGHDPVAVARAFAAAGAPRLHVVDLDGAREGRPVHRRLVGELATAVPVPVQVGGGIRDAATAEAYLNDGAAAVIFGTVAVRRPEVVTQVAARYPGRVLVSLDLKDGQAAVEGWTATAPPSPASASGPGDASPDALLTQLLAHLKAAGVTELIVTDTGRDGTLAGVDPAVFRPFLEAGFRVIAAGGVRDVADVVRLRKAGLAGVIAGRALYEGTLDLAAALAAALGPAGTTGDRPQGPTASQGGPPPTTRSPGRAETDPARPATTGTAGLPANPPAGPAARQNAGHPATPPGGSAGPQTVERPPTPPGEIPVTPSALPPVTPPAGPGRGGDVGPC